MRDKEDVKALILSGGGAGTFQYGAFDHIYNHILEEEEKFKIVCGVSAGAMNGAMIAQNKFELGKNIWMEQIQNKVPAFKMKYSRITMILYGLLPGIAMLNKLKKADSIFMNEKLKEILEDACRDLVQIIEENETYLRFGVVDYQTGEYISIDPTSADYRDRIVDVIIASITIPLAFPPVQMKSHQFFDGGVINITPFSDIFEITRKESFKEKYNLKSIYSILCSPLSTHESKKEYRGLIDIAERTLDILAKEIYVNDKDIFDRTNAFVWFREEIEKKFPNEKKELEKIYKRIFEKTKIDVTKYYTAESKVIAPDPKKWNDFLESELFPEDVKKYFQKPTKKDNNSEKLFWEQFPKTLSRDPEKLIAAYHFGMFTAREVLGSKR